MPITVPDCAKVQRFGKVAVIISPGFGSGWYSWHNIEELLFDPKVVDMIERGAAFEEITLYCDKTYEHTRQKFWGGTEDLEIVWIPEGSIFRISEYDGSERLVLQDDDDWLVA